MLIKYRRHASGPEAFKEAICFREKPTSCLVKALNKSVFIESDTTRGIVPRTSPSWFGFEVEKSLLKYSMNSPSN